jgi:hypothetical protein
MSWQLAVVQSSKKLDLEGVEVLDGCRSAGKEHGHERARSHFIAGELVINTVHKKLYEWGFSVPQSIQSASAHIL